MPPSRVEVRGRPRLELKSKKLPDEPVGDALGQSLIAAREGDRNAQRRFYEETFQHIRGWIVQFGMQRDVADDHAHDLMIRLLGFDPAHEAPRFQNKGRTWAWLKTQAKFFALELLRRPKDAFPLNNTPSPTNDESEGQERLIEAAADALRQLDADHRMVVILHCHSGCSLRDVARRCGIPESTVYSRYRTAKRRIRTYLVERYPDVADRLMPPDDSKGGRT